MPWTEGEWLEPPTHELHGQQAEGALSALEVLLNEASADIWHFRRNPAITRPLGYLGQRSPQNIPFLSPEIVLLYKAKLPRPEDTLDFGAVLPLLEEESRCWLIQALAICHPGHPWLAQLRADQEL